MRNKTRCLALIVGLTGAWGAAVQVPPILRPQGVFVTRVGGAEIAREEFRIERTDEGWEAFATVTARGRAQEIITRQEAGGAWTFSVTVAGQEALAATLDPAAGVARFRAPSPAEVETGADLLLENLVWHHFVPLLHAFREAGNESRRFSLFLPSAQMTLDVTLQLRGRLEVAGDPVEVLHAYRMTPSIGSPLDLWANQAGEPVFFRVPAQQLEAFRQDYEGLGDLIGDSTEAAAKLKEVDNPAVRTEAVTFASGQLSLAGSLTLPADGRGPWPGVVFISGSGAQNRNGAPGSDGLPLRIAEFLSERGFVVLRHDDRGAGESGLPSGPTSYFDLVSDSRAALALLRDREETEGRLFVIGHSEGALTATILGAEEEGVAGVVTMAGTSIPIDRLIREQALYQRALGQLVDPSDDGWVSPLVRQLLRISDEAREGRRDVGISDVYEYMRQHQQIDPRRQAGRATAPILVLQGARDRLVMPYHAIRLAEAARSAGAQVRLRIFPELGHSFRAAATSELAEEVLEVLHGWMQSTLSN